MDAGASRELSLRETRREAELAQTRAELLAIDGNVASPIGRVDCLRCRDGELGRRTAL